MRIEELRRAVGIAHEGDRILSGSIAEHVSADQIRVFTRCCRQGELAMDDNILVLLEVIAEQRTADNPWLAKLPADAKRTREVTFVLGMSMTKQSRLDLISFGMGFFETLAPVCFGHGTEPLPCPTRPRRISELSAVA